MKLGWGILQALGYASNSRIWQVRNPKTMNNNQERVLANSVNVFKNQSDFRIVRNQLQNYNYSGALATLENSELHSQITQALMEYGYYRLAFDFKSAREISQDYQQKINQELVNNIDKLYDENILELLQEVYYKGNYFTNQTIRNLLSG